MPVYLTRVVYHRLATSVLETRVATLERQLKRAHSALAILYTGTRARRKDGTVDTDAIVDACVGGEA